MKLYPHLKIGQQCFKNALIEADPAIQHVSDWFHLLRNLTDYAKKSIQSSLPAKVILAPPENAIELPVDKAIEYYMDGDRKKMVTVEEVRELARQGMS